MSESAAALARVVAEVERWTAQAAKPAARLRAAKAAPQHTAAASTAQRKPFPFPLLYLRPPPPSPPLPRPRSPATNQPAAVPHVRRRPGRKAGSRAGKEAPPLPFPSLEGALRTLPGRSAPPPPSGLLSLRAGITAAAAEPGRGAPAAQVEPHGGRGALPSAGGSPSDLLFLAGGGRLLLLLA
nr:uncharacterized protein LOC127347269 [Lolium perenne]